VVCTTFLSNVETAKDDKELCRSIFSQSDYFFDGLKFHRNESYSTRLTKPTSHGYEVLDGCLSDIGSTKHQQTNRRVLFFSADWDNNIIFLAKNKNKKRLRLLTSAGMMPSKYIKRRLYLSLLLGEERSIYYIRSASCSTVSVG
jgi:hypothetical protein